MTDIWTGAAKRLDAWDFGRMGRLLGTGEDEIRAVVEVETAGGGFDAKGRLKMLFEPHVFWRELGETKRPLAETQGLAYRKWGARPYPADSYPRLALAITIDRRAALRSASWGMGQIMGFNAKLAGFVDEVAMIEAFAADEENQLRGMVNFILTEHLDDELRRHDWAGFARGYNGPGAATNHYPEKLAAAFAKWRARPDATQP